MLRVRVLGPLEVERDAGPVAIAGRRQRAALAILAMHANRVVPVDTLIDGLWGETPPPTAPTALQNAVSLLRRTLGDEAIETRAPGYVLHLDGAALDAVRFEMLLGRGRAGAPEERLRSLEEALGLWRGPAYAELRDEVFAQGEIRRLEELRLVALEERLDALLAAGDHAAAVGELEALVERHPHRERLQALLMLALYRSGRQTDALDTYHAARRALVDQLGIEPGRELQALHAAMLRQEPSLDAPGATSPEVEHVDEVLRALLAARLVPVVGPGRTDLAERLAASFRLPTDALARVSEHVAVIDGVGPLYDELHAALDTDAEPGAVHRLLASLPGFLRAHGLPQLLVVSTGYDDTVEAALREAGEAFDLVSYIARGPSRGRFLYVPAEGEARVVDEPNADATISTEHVPVILKIHGLLDRRPTREWESFVVTEDDYIDYLAGVDPASAVPVTLAAKLRRSHLLFLGYDIDDWSLRVFLRRLWSDERFAYRSWAVRSDPMPLEREFWRHLDVQVVDAPLDDFVAELASRTVAG